MNRPGSLVAQRISIVAALLVMIASASTAYAVTRTWVTFGSGAFNDGNNWFPNGAPGAADFVSFEVGFGSPYTVTFPGNALGDPAAAYATSFLRVRDNAVTFAGSTQFGRGASTYSVTSTTQMEANRGIIIGVSPGENAALSVSQPGIACCGNLSSFSAVAATLGDVASSAGTLNMNTGAFNITGSDFTQTQLIIGNSGTGTLNVNSGADVNVSGFNSKTSLGHKAGSSGTVSINGAGSTWTTSDQLWIGELGSGSLTVQNGGTLNTSSGAGNATIIGVFGGGNGMATVTGPGSTWTQTDGLTVGNSGNGTLTVANGGALTTTGVSIGGGSTASGSVTVTGAGSMWNSGSVNVGSTGDASLAIQNGGAATTGTALIRALNGGTGQVLVSGAGSSWNVTTGALSIGLPEPGFTTSPTSLTISNGGSVTAAHALNLDTNSTLNFQGGTLTAAEIGLNGLQFNGTFNWTGGTLHVGTFRKSLTNQAGTLAPGNVIGRTDIDGNYTQQASGKLAIDIGGATPSTQYDVVGVEGSASIAGQLLLSLANGFPPTGAQTFTIMNALNPISGAFSNVANGQRLTTTSGDGSFLVNYGSGSTFDPASIVLSSFIAVPLPGDYNHNNFVDAADYTLWRDTLGQTGSGLAADGNGNNVIDPGDFDVWRSHFGQSGSVGSGAQSNGAVPEPTTFLSLIAAMAIAPLMRRRSR